MQFKREMLALQLLDAQALLCESAILLQHPGEARLGALAGAQLSAGLAVASPGQPDQSDCEHQQAARQLVELQILPAARESEQRLGELKMRGQKDAEYGEAEHSRRVQPGEFMYPPRFRHVHLLGKNSQSGREAISGCRAGPDRH